MAYGIDARGDLIQLPTMNHPGKTVTSCRRRSMPTPRSVRPYPATIILVPNNGRCVG